MVLILSCLVAALILVVAALLFDRFALARQRDAYRRMWSLAREDALAAEARSRGVGGTGEHEGVVVVPLDPVSRVGSMYRDPRFAIPGQGGQA